MFVIINFSYLSFLWIYFIKLINKGAFLLFKLSTPMKIAICLILIGSINWGIIGIINIDILATIFGVYSYISRIIYILIGLSGIYLSYYILNYIFEKKNKR